MSFFSRAASLSWPRGACRICSGNDMPSRICRGSGIGARISAPLTFSDRDFILAALVEQCSGPDRAPQDRRRSAPASRRRPDCPCRRDPQPLPDRTAAQSLLWTRPIFSRPPDRNVASFMIGSSCFPIKYMIKRNIDKKERVKKYRNRETIDDQIPSRGGRSRRFWPPARFTRKPRSRSAAPRRATALRRWWRSTRASSRSTVSMRRWC